MLKLGQASPDASVVQEIHEEWEAFVEANAYRDENEQLIWGESLIRSMGETGLATLRYLARRGHFESAKVLKETFLGLPEQSLAVRIRNSTAQETGVMISEFLVREMSLTPEVAGKFMERLERMSLEDVALNALPEPK